VGEVTYRNIKELLPLEERFAPGHGLCAGCVASLVMRYLTKIAGKDIILVSATGCVEVSTTPYPRSAWTQPWIHVAFENAAAVASGVKAAYTAMKRKGLVDRDVRVMAIAGDGGTADIGFQALSGAMERGDRILYVCYDNEAYMNTGIQRSGTTPWGAWTTTSPAGQKTWKKDLFSIAVAHRVKYAATASPAYLIDMVNKIEKGLEWSDKGPAFLHILAPCVPGWRVDPALGIKLARLAVRTGLWPLLEYEEGGEPRLTVQVPRRLPVTEYLKLQRRFRPVLSSQEAIARIQAWADQLAEKYGMGPVTAPRA
jgi:pyruvate ferredoxin oxidoreductase beta subunit